MSGVNRNTTRPAKPVYGFSLTELMIGLSIGLTVIAAAGQLFSIVRSKDRWLKHQADISASSRFLLFQLNAQIRQSGYYGITAAPARLRFLIAGRDKGICAQLPWPDLVRRRTSAFSATSGIPRCIRQRRRSNRYLRGDALVLNLSSNVKHARLSRLSRTNPDTLYIHSNMQQQTVFTGRQVRQLRNLPVLSLRRLDPVIYYIGSHPAVRCHKQPVPGLIRIARTRTGRFRREMVWQGFEHFRLAFGVATGNRRKTIQYRHPEEVRHWHQVKTLRYWILLRTRCPAWPHPRKQHFRLHDEVYRVQDRYWRKLLVMTVALRNPARREKTE